MEKAKRKSIYLVFVYILAIAGIALVGYFAGCPLKRIFSVPCPTCGMMRAHISLLKLDFKSAFEFHPLFFIPVPLIAYFIHKPFFKFKINKILEYVVLGVCIFLFAAVYLYRLLVLKPEFLF